MTTTDTVETIIRQHVRNYQDMSPMVSLSQQIYDEPCQIVKALKDLVQNEPQTVSGFLSHSPLIIQFFDLPFETVDLNINYYDMDYSIKAHFADAFMDLVRSLPEENKAEVLASDVLPALMIKYGQEEDVAREIRNLDEQKQPNVLESSPLVIAFTAASNATKDIIDPLLKRCGKAPLIRFAEPAVAA